MDLKSLYIEFHLCLNLIGIWKFFWSSVIQFDDNFNEFVLSTSHCHF